MNRRDFMRKSTAAAMSVAALGLGADQVTEARSLKRIPPRLFAIDLPHDAWIQFEADGFSQPACGMIFHADEHPPYCCGVPLGGLSTGCLDLDRLGTFGFNTIFMRYPRRAKLFAPFLGLAVGGQTWVLADHKAIEGGLMQGCIEPGADPYNPHPNWARSMPRLAGVRPAKIHYWGHYPIADIEYETDAPISAALRAWSPFLPGDANDSDIPGAVFEVRLRNLTRSTQRGTLAFSLPGPTEEEAGDEAFIRHPVMGRFHGLAVTGARFGYALGVVGEEKLRLGTDLSASETGWARIAHELPQASTRPTQHAPQALPGPVTGAGASVAVDFTLASGEDKTVRFILAWYSPHWGVNAGGYTYMYAARYADAVAVANDLAQRHGPLLRRVLNWQQAIYASNGLPVWLRETLVNNLALIPEDGYWAQSKPPLSDWTDSTGLFGMLESPRFSPQIECIPCSWYGNLPIVSFFPDLAHTTLKGYKHYQSYNGAPPFVFGPKEEMWAEGHAWQDQVSLNGVCFVDMVHRLWLRTGDRALLDEFYPAVKLSTSLTALMGEAPESVISMPPGDGQTEWWEGWPWSGMTTHAGGMHLSSLAIAAQMAEQAGDPEFTQQCRDWLTQGQRAMEEKMWDGDTYLLMRNLNTGKQVDKIMANQLDAEWANAFHGLPGVFRSDRVKTVLDTVKRTCLVWCGAISFSARKGQPELATYGIFVPEIMILGMTYLYRGEQDLGLDIIKHLMTDLVIKQRHGWDTPNQIRADTGAATAGSDYYQNMILWAVPAALEGKSLRDYCASGGLIDRVLQAGRAQTSRLP